MPELGAGQAVAGHGGHDRGEGRHRGLDREVLQEQAREIAAAEAGDVPVDVAPGCYRRGA